MRLEVNRVPVASSLHYDRHSWYKQYRVDSLKLACRKIVNRQSAYWTAIYFEKKVKFTNVISKRISKPIVWITNINRRSWCSNDFVCSSVSILLHFLNECVMLFIIIGEHLANRHKEIAVSFFAQ